MISLTKQNKKAWHVGACSYLSPSTQEAEAEAGASLVYKARSRQPRLHKEKLPLKENQRQPELYVRFCLKND